MQHRGLNFAEAIHSAALKKYHKAGINKNTHTTNGVEERPNVFYYSFLLQAAAALTPKKQLQKLMRIRHCSDAGNPERQI